MYVQQGDAPKPEPFKPMYAQPSVTPAPEPQEIPQEISAEEVPEEVPQETKKPEKKKKGWWIFGRKNSEEDDE